MGSFEAIQLHQTKAEKTVKKQFLIKEKGNFSHGSKKVENNNYLP